MGSGEKTLYPMLGVGAFFVMFWVGFVVGHELGLSCGLFLLNALFFACSGAWFVVRLEFADACRRPPPPCSAASGRQNFHALPLATWPHPFALRAR